MNDRPPDSSPDPGADPNADPSEAAGTSADDTRRATPNARQRPISMHEGIAVWCDCCSCEAEPYWAEIAEEMGMDLGSDYEDPERDRR